MRPLTTAALYDHLDEITREAVAARCKLPAISIQRSLGQLFDFEGLKLHIEQLIVLTHGLGRTLKEMPDEPIPPPPPKAKASKQPKVIQAKEATSPRPLSQRPPPTPTRRWGKKTGPHLPHPHEQGLTGRQLEILNFIRSFIAENHYSPSMREIGDHFKIASPNGVLCHLKSLEIKGLLRRNKGRSRAIVLLEEDE